MREAVQAKTNRGSVLNTLSSIFVHVPLPRKQQESVVELWSSRERRNIHHPSVLGKGVWGSLCYWDADSVIRWAWEGPAFFLFPLPSAWLAKVVPSSEFFLWVLKSEAQTLTLSIFQPMYLFWPLLLREPLWCHPPAPSPVLPLRLVPTPTPCMVTFIVSLLPTLSPAPRWASCQHARLHFSFFDSPLV